MARAMPLGAMGFTNSMAMTPLLVLLCLAIAGVIGFISSVFPAWSASRTPIVEALRHTG